MFQVKVILIGLQFFSKLKLLRSLKDFDKRSKVDLELDFKKKPLVIVK